MANVIPPAALWYGQPTPEQVRSWRDRYYVDNDNKFKRGRGALFARVAGGNLMQIRYGDDGRAVNDPYPLPAPH